MDEPIEVRAHNRSAWNRQVADGNRWTLPVGQDEIRAARNGEFSVLLTPSQPVPMRWFPDLAGCEILCLASAGGQQAPLLAAAGGQVTVFDNSPMQLKQDQRVADREKLTIHCVEGDMRDLSAFTDASFDLIFHPCSNSFIPDVVPVWQECFRVLRSGGSLLAGFTNPVRYLFDDERTENGKLDVRYSLPYSDLKDLPPEFLSQLLAEQRPLEFGHTLEDQIGGQLRSGFVLTDMYEDRYPPQDQDPLSRFMASFIATRSRKLPA